MLCVQKYLSIINYPQISDKSDIWRGSLTPPGRLTRLPTFPHKVMSSMHLQSIFPCISNFSFHSFYFCTPESSTLTQAGFLQYLKEFMLESTLGKLNSSTMERQPSNQGWYSSLTLCHSPLWYTGTLDMLHWPPPHLLHYSIVLLTLQAIIFTIYTSISSSLRFLHQRYVIFLLATT